MKLCASYTGERPIIGLCTFTEVLSNENGLFYVLYTSLEETAPGAFEFRFCVMQSLY